MLRLDDFIDNLLDDDEYDTDVATCDTAKRVIQKAAQGIDKGLSAATADVTPSENSAAAAPANFRRRGKLGTLLGTVRILN
jgi:multidrug resistance efflux pump